MIETPDQDLLDRARAGCEESWTTLYRRHRGRIYRFALHMCGSADMAEDAVQETFLALLERMDRYDESRGTLEAWLLGVARNKVLRLLERDREAIHDTEPSGNLLSEMAKSESIGAVRKAVLGLPASYREVVVLCDLEEMEYTEAARILNCPLGTVRSRLHRARQMLMERLMPVEKGGVVQ